MINKPYSESSEQNKNVILDIILPILSSASSVFEIGSGTGQHAIFFAGKMPHLKWQTSDRQDSIAGIKSWIEDTKLPNVTAPILLDVNQSVWPEQKVDAVFTANTIHIMSHTEVEKLFEGCASMLKQGSDLLIYGPFNYNGSYTSESNERFDQWLKSRNPLSCIKDFESIQQLAKENDLLLQKDYTMPANNRILHFTKSTSC